MLRMARCYPPERARSITHTKITILPRAAPSDYRDQLLSPSPLQTTTCRLHDNAVLLPLRLRLPCVAHLEKKRLRGRQGATE